MPEVTVNGTTTALPSGITVAAAVLLAGEKSFRHSVTGEPRGPLCGMGICFECRLTINGIPHERSCQILIQPGMDIRTT